MRVHDQFHSEAEGFAGAIHDEQCSRKFHNITGETFRSQFNLAVNSTINLNFSIIEKLITNVFSFDVGRVKSRDKRDATLHRVCI